MRIGQRVLYSSLGFDARVAGTIVGEGTEAGQIVYDVRLDNGREKWGYAAQFAGVGVDGHAGRTKNETPASLG